MFLGVYQRVGEWWVVGGGWWWRVASPLRFSLLLTTHHPPPTTLPLATPHSTDHGAGGDRSVFRRDVSRRPWESGA